MNNPYLRSAETEFDDWLGSEVTKEFEEYIRGQEMPIDMTRGAISTDRRKFYASSTTQILYGTFAWGFKRGIDLCIKSSQE